MTTNNFEGNAADYGLPSESELERFASGLLSDIDGSLFEPYVCADGIEKLVTTGDTGVLDTAAHKVSKVFGGQLKTQEYESILDDLKRETSFDELSGVTSEYSGLAEIGGGFRELEDHTPAYEYTDPARVNHTQSGYAPQVISQQQAASGSDITVRTTAYDHNVIPDRKSVV